MRNHHQYPEENGLLYQNLQSCNCCPYGYHIDLDFVRYCESLANLKPSDGQLLRRDKRLSRKSLEVMLGLENFFQWEPTDIVKPVEEVPFEIEPDSPRMLYKSQDYPSNSCGVSPTTTTSSPEASAFMHDVLDDVVSDFERTLERTKKKDRKSRGWGQYFEEIESCVSGNKSHSKHEAQHTTQEKEDAESIESMGSELSTHALHNIRDQMAISLSRMRDLEEQVKSIPVLQKQLSALREEKRLLELQLSKRSESPRTNSTSLTSPKLAAVQFTPQRISPVSLECLGSRLRSESPSEPTKKLLKRDVGITCVAHTKEASTLASRPMVRTVGSNPANTNGIHEEIFTKHQIDEIIAITIDEWEKEKEHVHQQKMCSVGTQILIKEPQPPKNHVSIQTIPERCAQTVSQSVMASPTTRDVFTLIKPETRTIGSSDHKTADNLCDKCSLPKRTVGCGPDPEETKQYLSLKSLDMPPRSLSFSLGENERLNIKRKSMGTQCQFQVHHVGVQSLVPTCSMAIQHVPLLMTKSSQCMIENVSKQTDTTNLIKVMDTASNTEERKVDAPITYSSSTNTDIVKLKDRQTNTLPPPSTKSCYVNTEKVRCKDVGCGDPIKPHISIACADNYCDSCKDSIKNLAREFSKVLASPVLGSNVNGEVSRIPRPTTLITSPRPERKKFMRQNTYTISTPSPPSENHAISESTSETTSNSLDSVNTVREVKTTGLIKHEEYTRSSAEKLISSIPTTVLDLDKDKDKNVFDKLETKTWALEDIIKEKPLVNGKDVQEQITTITKTTTTTTTTTTEEETENLQPQESSHQIQDMLLNQIATAASVPRTKATPSKEMKAAMKVINDSLQKSNLKSINLKNANIIVEKEWFKISSTDKANPLDVEDYLDCFEEYSNNLIKYIVNMKDTNGNSAMHYAVSHGNFDVVSILLDSKVCDVNQTNNAGYTCVMLVSLAKLKNSAHRTVVQRLFQMADVNIRAKKHCQTALMLAVSHGNLDMVEILLQAGADINIQDEDGSTALMCAAEHGRIDIVKHLLAQQDCDSLIQDVDGSTAFKIAWQAGHRDIGLLLYVHEQMLRSKMPSRSDSQRSQNVQRHAKHH